MPLTPEDYLKIYIKNPAWSKVIKQYRFKILKILQGKKPNKIFSPEIIEYFPDQNEQLDPEKKTLPPYKGYLHEPKQIVQIKDILNALYYTELAFVGLENLEIKDNYLSYADTLHFAWDKITEYICQANYLITHLDIDLNSFLGPEISFLKQCLSAFQALSDYLDDDKTQVVTETAQNPHDLSTDIASLHTPFQLLVKNLTRYDNEKRSQDIESLIQYFESIKTKTNRSAINKSIIEFESIIRDIKNIPNILTENPEEKTALEPLKNLIEKLKAIKSEFESSVELTTLVEKFVIKLSNWLDFKESFFFEIYFKLKKMAPNSFSYSSGQIAGNIVEQLQPNSGKVDYEFLTTKAAAIPALVESITQRLKDFLLGKVSPDDIFLTRYKKEQTYKELDFFTSTLTKQNFSDLKEVANNLFNSIESLQSDDIFLPARIFYYVSVLRHTITLAISTFEHLADLNGSSQAAIKHILSKIKYEYLVHLFSLMDRLEDELMLKPGLLSKPMMASLKEFFELITTYISMAVDFSEEEKALLVIEDPKFVLLRILNTHQRISLSRRKLNIDITQAETAFNNFFNLLQSEKQNSWIISIKNKASLLEDFQHLKAYFDKIADGRYSKLLVHALALNTGKSFYSLNIHKLGYAPYEKLLVQDIAALRACVLEQIHSARNTELLHLKLNRILIETILAHSALKVSPLKEPPNAFGIDEGNVLSQGPEVVSEFYEKQDELTEVQKAYAAFNHFFNIIKKYESLDAKLINLDIATKKQLLKDYLQFKPYVLATNLKFFTKESDPILDALQKENEPSWQILSWQSPYSELITLNDLLEIEPQITPKIKEDLDKEDVKRHKRDELNTKCNIIVGRNVINGGILTQQRVIINPDNCTLDQLYKLYEFYIHKEAQIELAIQAYNGFMSLLPAPDSNLNIEYLDELTTEIKANLLKLYGRFQIYYLSTFQGEEAHIQMKNTDNKIVQALTSPLPLTEITKRYKLADFYTNLIGELLVMSRITCRDRATTYQQLAIQKNGELMRKITALQQARLAKNTSISSVYKALIKEIAPVDAKALIRAVKKENRLIKSTTTEMYNGLIKRISQERNLKIFSQILARTESSVDSSFLSSPRIASLEESIIKLLNNFNNTLRKNLQDKLEQPKVKSKAWFSHGSRISAAITRDWTYLTPKSFARLIKQDFHPPFPEVEDEKKREEQSKQTRGLKELFNTLYFLKDIVENIQGLSTGDLENISLIIEDKIDSSVQGNANQSFKTIRQLSHTSSLIKGFAFNYSDKVKKIDYSTRLITIYFHLYKIQESLKRLYHDPHYQFLAQQLGNYVNELLAYLKDKTKPYQVRSQEVNLGQNKDVSFEIIWYLINAYSLAPLHIKALSEGKPASKEELDSAHKQAKDITRQVEDIINSSSSYLKLLFKTPKMYWLFQKFKTKFTELTSTSHKAVITHIKDINDIIFAEILIATDEFEDQLKLKPGLLATTMQQLLQIFYEGLLEPLNFNYSYYLTLASSTVSIEKRLENNVINLDSARKEEHSIQDNFDKLTRFLKALTLLPQNEEGKKPLFLQGNELELRQTLDLALPILLEEAHLFNDRFEPGALELSDDIFKLLLIAINKKPHNPDRTLDLIEINKILLSLEEEYLYIDIDENEADKIALDIKIKDIKSLQSPIRQYIEQQTLDDEPRDQNHPVAEPQIRDTEILKLFFNYLLTEKTKPKINITSLFNLELKLKTLLLNTLLGALKLNFKQLAVQDKTILQKSLVDTLILKRDLQKREHQKLLDKIDLLDKKAILDLSFKYLINVFSFLSDMDKQQKEILQKEKAVTVPSKEKEDIDKQKAALNKQKAHWIFKLEILTKAKKIKSGNSSVLHQVIRYLKHINLDKEKQNATNLNLAAAIFNDLLSLLKLNDDENDSLELMRINKKQLVAALQKQSSDVETLKPKLSNLIKSFNLKQTLAATIEICVDILNSLATAKSLDEFTKAKLNLASEILVFFKIDKYKPILPFINSIKSADDISEAQTKAFELTLILFLFIQNFILKQQSDLKEIEQEIDEFLPKKDLAEEEYQLLEKAKRQTLDTSVSAADLKQTYDTIYPLLIINTSYTTSLQYLVPFVQKLLRIYQGKLNSSEIEKETFNERNVFLQQEKKRQDKNNQKIRQRLIKKEFILVINNLHKHSSALLNFEPLQVEYMAKLKVYIEQQETDIRIKAESTFNVKQAVKDTIYMHINQFERKHYRTYLHLDKMAAEIVNFQNYLTAEMDKAAKQEAYNDPFEDKKELQNKKEKVDNLYNFAIDSSLTIENRIQKIHTEVLAIGNLIESKVNHTSIILWIKQWVLSFLELIHLYTRDSLVHYNKILKEAGNPPSISEVNSRYSFFPSRKKISGLQEWHDFEHMEKINPGNMLYSSNLTH